MNCPVCNTTDLAEDTLQCPQCQSDLEVFRMLVEASEERQKSRKIISALGLVAAVTAIGWSSVGFFSAPSSPAKEQEVVELAPVITEQNESRPMPSDSELIEMLREENALLKSAKTTSVKNTVEPAAKSSISKGESTRKGDIVHTVKNGETLWILARKYYKDGSKYKKIARDNGISHKKRLSKGMKLTIKMND